MNILLKFGIGADSGSFGLPRFATPHYQMGVFKMGFAENLGHFGITCRISKGPNENPVDEYRESIHNYLAFGECMDSP